MCSACVLVVAIVLVGSCLREGTRMEKLEGFGDVFLTRSNLEARVVVGVVVVGL